MYHIDGLLLENIRTVYSGAQNDIIICRDSSAPADTLYTCLVVHRSETARMMLDLLENLSCPVYGGHAPYRFAFSESGSLVLVFEYREERRFSRFSASQLATAYDREQVCICLVAACMSEMLPPPLLFLVLNDDCMNLSPDGQVYFNMFFHLEKLDQRHSEKHCANRCAQIVYQTLSRIPERKRRKMKSFTLLDKKIQRQAYSTLTELYKDIQMTQLPSSPAPFTDRLRQFWNRNKDAFFHLLLVLSVIFAVLALTALLSRILFGGAGLPFWAGHSLDRIGTESLR